MDVSLSKLRETVKDRKAWSAAVHGVIKSWTRLSDWIPATEHSAVEDPQSSGNMVAPKYKKKKKNTKTVTPPESLRKRLLNK